MILLDILRQLNWLDFFVVILLFRIGYIAIKNGLPIELFKLLGTLLAVYLAMHYYTSWSNFVGERLGQGKIAFKFLEFLSFLVLVILGQLVFVFLRSVFWRFIKMEATPKLNKWGGLILGMGRAVLVASLIMYILVVSSIGYLRNSIKDSYSGKRLFKMAPTTYSVLWNNLASKFMSKEKFNEATLRVQEELTRK